MRPEHVIIIVSALGGIIGGMGMGGGTLLIPLLTLCAGLEQHLAQAINLISFIPMSIIALCIHKKNGYVCFKKALPIAVVALVGAIGGSMLTRYAGGYELRASFGAFLILLGVIRSAEIIRTVVREKKKQKVAENAAAQKAAE